MTATEAELEQAVAHLLENPGEAQAMAERGQKCARQDFTWEVLSRHLLEFWQRVSDEAGLPQGAPAE